MLREVIDWWLRQMRELFGERGGGYSGQLRNALLIDSNAAGDDGTVTLIRRRRRRESVLGRYRLDQAGLAMLQRAVRGHARAAALVLRLPAHLLLEQAVSLPLLAEREPERVLGYEMDRLTPFAATEVFWGWTIERQDRAGGRLHLLLSLVPREGVGLLLASLGRIGLEPGMLEVPAADGTPRVIALRHPRTAVRRRLTAVAAMCCGVLAIAAIVQPFVLQAMALSETAARLDALRPRVAEVEALRRRIAARTAGVDVIAAERTRVGDPLAVLATLTDILPDDAFLTGFSLSQRKLTIDGKAGAAARLIAALATDPTLRNPTFAAPVMRDARGQAEMFTIRAELGP